VDIDDMRLISTLSAFVEFATTHVSLSEVTS